MFFLFFSMVRPVCCFPSKKKKTPRASVRFCRCCCCCYVVRDAKKTVVVDNWWVKTGGRLRGKEERGKETRGRGKKRREAPPPRRLRLGKRRGGKLDLLSSDLYDDALTRSRALSSLPLSHLLPLLPLSRLLPLSYKRGFCFFCFFFVCEGGGGFFYLI